MHVLYMLLTQKLAVAYKSITPDRISLSRDTDSVSLFYEVVTVDLLLRNAVGFVKFTWQFGDVVTCRAVRKPKEFKS